MRWLKRSYAWTWFYSLFLLILTLSVVLNAFVIVSAETAVTDAFEVVADTESGVFTDTTYTDENISITITTIRVHSTTVYVADVVLSSLGYLKTAFAGDTYGKNVTAKTSEMAEDNGAIFAVNGDYYGFRSAGAVLRNGILYRSSSRGNGYETLAILSDGTFSILEDAETDAEALEAAGAWQIFSFGPGLIVDGEISVSATDEVDQSMTSNPRTGIGIVSPLHYVFIVSDGRTTASKGLTLYQLAEVFASYGCTDAYNLDGGGSSTMWFNGQIVNVPSGSSGERKVSDIVYIG